MAAVDSRVKTAVDQGAELDLILNEGLINTMDEVGASFEAGEFFVPEMLIAARAMKAGITILRQLLAQLSIEPVGKIVIGTVSDDFHDIRKNLVGLI